MPSLRSAILGYPRIGARRELKKSLEAYWAGNATEEELRSTARGLRENHWKQQDHAGIDLIPSGDFSLYDHVLDTACMVGAVPPRFEWEGGAVDLDTYFAMARGIQEKEAAAGKKGAAALEMTKWFDTNYHYLVPELAPDQRFELSSTTVIDHFLEAKGQGMDTRPVLLGPVSFLLLSKIQVPNDGASDVAPLDLLDRLLPVYASLLEQLSAAGATSVQLDEPCLVLDLDEDAQAAYEQSFQVLSDTSDVDLHVTTYFGALRENASIVLDAPIDALHLDLIRAPGSLDSLLARSEEIPDDLTLSLGLVDGRNVWRTDLDAALETTQAVVEALGPDRVIVATSCSLLHVPVDLETEEALPDDITPWLAFAKQKLDEVAAVASAARGQQPDEQKPGGIFETARDALNARRASTRVTDAAVQDRVQEVTSASMERSSPHVSRRTLQNEHLNLPLFPTTTIGSFPQTDEIRIARRRFKNGEIGQEAYESFLEKEIEQTVQIQEEIGLDVLVHGEPERSDMVEYFGQKLQGFLFTDHGWVQSYGSRCVRPPIIVGDVARKEPMTVRWSSFAQSLTDQPVKGMLTGPVTMLQWSFVRDDQSRSETCQQIALALRDEVDSLQEAGISVIQVDEPALREGLPLREDAWDEYLTWAVDAFRLTVGVAHDQTQIHTHMCYADFGDIIASIARMDADVISIESSRSKMDLLNDFELFDYPNQIGPGVYDIHSPRIPTTEEIEELLHRALDVLDADQLWVNPDCGLKTRRWDEVKPALRNMVEAAGTVRDTVSEPA